MAFALCVKHLRCLPRMVPGGLTMDEIEDLLRYHQEFGGGEEGEE